MTNESRFPWWGWLMVLCLVPVVYVLSVFPVAWILHQFHLGEPEWLKVIYGPVIWAIDEWEIVGIHVESIVRWMGID